MHDANKVSQSNTSEERAKILAFASDILKTTRDHDVVNRIQVAVGYSQLAEMHPWNEGYRLKLRAAIDDLTALVQQKNALAA